MISLSEKNPKIIERKPLPRVVERTNIRYRGINFVIEINEEYVDTSNPEGNTQFWAKLEWPRGHLAERLESAAFAVGVPCFRFEFFTCYTCRGAHRRQGEVFEEAAAYIKGTIDDVYDRAVDEARKNADRAEAIINEIKEALTQREWEK